MRAVRRNEITSVPSWFKPVVRTVTMPTFGRERDSRISSTSDREWTVSPSNTGLGRRTSSHPRLAITFCETSLTLCPVTSESVRQLLTKGFPNSVCAAYWWSEVDRRGVLGEEREPDVIRGRDRPAERVLVDVADEEVLKIDPASPL